MTKRIHTDSSVSCMGCGRSFGIIQQSHIEKCPGLIKIGINTRKAYVKKFGTTKSQAAMAASTKTIMDYNKSTSLKQKRENGSLGWQVAHDNNPLFSRPGGIKCCEMKWADPEEHIRARNRLISLNLSGKMRQKPNLLEQRFQQLVGARIKFVGSTLWAQPLIESRFDNMTPDFLVIGANAVIEVFGNYWHRNDRAEDRVRLWNSAGYHCLVVWEKEIKNDPEAVRAKVNQFIEECLDGTRPRPLFKAD